MMTIIRFGLWLITMALLSCSGKSNITTPEHNDSINKSVQQTSITEIAPLPIFSSPWTKTKADKYGEEPVIEYLPVDKSHRMLFDTCIVAKKEKSYNGHELMETRYWLYPSNNKSSDSNYEMRCFSYLDTTICKFTCGGVDQIILNTPKRFVIIDLKYSDQRNIYAMYQRYNHIPDSLIKYMQICMAELPDAKFSRSGIAEDIRKTSWKAQFNKSVSLSGISLKSYSDKKFVYKIKFPFRSNRKSSIKHRLDKMPPFLIVDFENYMLDFTALGSFDHLPTDFSQYDD